MDASDQIIALERSALDRWIRADPDGYLDLYAADATYFDPFRETRVDGVQELRAQLAGIRGVKLPFTELRYEMIKPVVNVAGTIAVLTFNLVNFGRPEGTTGEVVLARWNATQVYQQTGREWRIIHTHWSFTLPQLAASPPGI